MSLDWQQLQERKAQLVEILSHTLESSKRPAIQKELAQLTSVLEKHESILALERQLIEVAHQARTEKDPELAQLFKDETTDLELKLVQERNALEDTLYPADERDDRSVFLEIRPGTGGQEAALFAGDLLKMYTNYAISKHWKVSVDSSSTTDLGGIREVVLHIQGKGVYGLLKHESGVHRVQRVPQTETQGRVHTSTATVAVLPEAEEVDVSINPSDLRIDVYRSSGAGGQHVNTTDSAVRITHLPTGVAVACQEERSQHKNKAKAMKLLQSRLLASQIEKQTAEMRKKRKEQVGTGERSEKVRTYNFPQNRVTDHQVEMTLKNLDMVMMGPALDDIIQALREYDRQERRKNPTLVNN